MQNRAQGQWERDKSFLAILRGISFGLYFWYNRIMEKRFYWKKRVAERDYLVCRKCGRVLHTDFSGEYILVSCLRCHESYLGKRDEFLSKVANDWESD
jgi:hypothetical protein